MTVNIYGQTALCPEKTKSLAEAFEKIIKEYGHEVEIKRVDVYVAFPLHESMGTGGV